jgi:hypothetical protein
MRIEVTSLADRISVGAQSKQTERVGRQSSPKRAMGSVASAQSSASDSARRALRHTYQYAPPAAAPTASTTFHFTRSTLAARDQFGRVRCRSMSRLLGALIAVLLALAGCAVLPASQPQPSITPTGDRPGMPASPTSPGLSPSQSATSATSAEVLQEQQFSLNDVAEFDDGLMIEIAGAVADKAAKTDRGAEATNGEIVTASVRIENKTKEPYDAETVLIGAQYGDGKDAQIIIDKTDELYGGFTGTVKPGSEAIASVGFAVPFSELRRVTFIVDPNDDVHEAISFTGTVSRD